MPLKTSPNFANPRFQKRVARDCTEQDVKKLARELATELRSRDVVMLEGPLGSGKSTFARFVVESLGARFPTAGSPTFALAHEYQTRAGEVIHVDFFRLKRASEIEDAGLASYFWERDAIILCEWISRFPAFLNSVRVSCARVWHIVFEIKSENTRNVQIEELRE